MYTIVNKIRRAGSLREAFDLFKALEKSGVLDMSQLKIGGIKGIIEA